MKKKKNLIIILGLVLLVLFLVPFWIVQQDFAISLFFTAYIVIGIVLGIITHILRYKKVKYIIPTVLGGFSLFCYYKIVTYKGGDMFGHLGGVGYPIILFPALLLYFIIVMIVLIEDIIGIKRDKKNS